MEELSFLTTEEIAQAKAWVEGREPEALSFEQGPVWDKLYTHYAFDVPEIDGGMPYGTAKARDGDPYNWMQDRLEEIFSQ